MVGQDHEEGEEDSNRNDIGSALERIPYFAYFNDRTCVLLLEDGDEFEEVGKLQRRATKIFRAL